MKPRAWLILPVVAAGLAGCLEVDQYPHWVDGQYDGKPDNPPQQVHFMNDRLAWNAALANRNHLQNEYGRMDQP